MTNDEIAIEICSKNAEEFSSMISVVVDMIFNTYTESELDIIGQAFANNEINTSKLCEHRRPK